MSKNILSSEPIPLCIDLDGTLLHSDILIESALVLLKRNPLYALLMVWWLLRGKANLKHQIARRAELELAGLPWNRALLEELEREKAGGRKLILCTATHRRYAEQIAAHLGIFAEVLASDAERNLAGRRKLEALRAEFGDKKFDYAGNSAADLSIWPHARKAIVVAARPGVLQRARQCADVERTFPVESGGIRVYLKAVRIHQWLKNLLLFVPLILSHRFQEGQLVFQAGLGFISFGLCASSVYVLNDLLDLADDRRHPSKRERPFASGRVPLLHGLLLLPLLLGGALAAALFLPWEFLGVLALYYATTLAYSWRLKRAVLLDVLVLAGLYTVRLIAGAAAAGVDISFWLLAFSMFLFFSLALVKRYSELLQMAQQDKPGVGGRGYYVGDLETLMHFGTTSGFMSVLVLALYINSTQVTALYSRPEAIWLLCPLMLYWITRIWMLTRRGQMHEDPVIFAIEDRRSHWLALAGLMVLWVAV